MSLLVMPTLGYTYTHEKSSGQKCRHLSSAVLEPMYSLGAFLSDDDDLSSQTYTANIDLTSRVTVCWAKVSEFHSENFFLPKRRGMETVLKPCKHCINIYLTSNIHLNSKNGSGRICVSLKRSEIFKTFFNFFFTV